IGRENLRNRRAHSLEHIRTRLVALDFILAHLQYEYLETEDDKLNYFCQQLDLPKELLPRKLYSGAVHNRTTERYFVDKFPQFLHLADTRDARHRCQSLYPRWRDGMVSDDYLRSEIQDLAPPRKVIFERELVDRHIGLLQATPKRKPTPRTAGHVKNSQDGTF